MLTTAVVKASQQPGTGAMIARLVGAGVDEGTAFLLFECSAYDFQSTLSVSNLDARAPLRLIQQEIIRQLREQMVLAGQPSPGRIIVSGNFFDG